MNNSDIVISDIEKKYLNALKELHATISNGTESFVMNQFVKKHRLTRLTSSVLCNKGIVKKIYLGRREVSYKWISKRPDLAMTRAVLAEIKKESRGVYTRRKAREKERSTTKDMDNKVIPPKIARTLEEIKKSLAEAYKSTPEEINARNLSKEQIEKLFGAVEEIKEFNPPKLKYTVKSYFFGLIKIKTEYIYQ